MNIPHLSFKKKSDKQTYSKKEICPKLKFGNSYKNTKVSQVSILEAIFFRLKTGCQWRELPMKQFFRKSYKWQSVYFHFRKWNLNGEIERLWIYLLEKYKHTLDMSSTQLDGSHTPAKRGGQAVAYQGRKKSRTTNMLIMADNKGVPIACSEAIGGNHNDAFELEKNVEQMLQNIKASNITTEGLFMNADAGFDTKEFRVFCYKNDIHANIDRNPRNGSEEEYLFDDLLYKCRFVIERTNAWLDGFKALLVRFETNKNHWKGLHLLAFMAILLRQL